MKRKLASIIAAALVACMLAAAPVMAFALDTNENPDPYQYATSTDYADGTYTVDVALGGGSGRSTVTSPATMKVKDGKAVADIEWSSSNYDYMIVDGQKYFIVNDDPTQNSVFEIPITAFDEPVDVVGDTTAMSTPHEVEYTLTFDSASVVEVKPSVPVVPIVIGAIVVAAVVVGIVVGVRHAKKAKRTDGEAPSD
jgi:hypothetical protein